MKAVILVGGAGTRLRPLTYVMPKCLLPVGGMPLLEWTMKYLGTHGITEFVVCVAYLKRQIITTVGDGSRLGVRVEYAEADSPMGTAGQLKTAEPFIDDTFLAMNGDIVTSLNISHLVRAHKERGGTATIALKGYDVKVPYGHVTADGDNVIHRFEEKPTLHLTANAGIYVLEKSIFGSIAAGRPCSLETEVFPSLLARGERLHSFYEEAYWNDVGTMGDFEKVNDEVLAMQARAGTSLPTA
jgi:mannose-1-phosphate guanylyltransferase / phosphomannomutase